MLMLKTATVLEAISKRRRTARPRRSRRHVQEHHIRRHP